MLAGLSMCVFIQATCQECLMLTAECVGEVIVQALSVKGSTPHHNHWFNSHFADNER